MVAKHGALGCSAPLSQVFAQGRHFAGLVQQPIEAVVMPGLMRRVRQPRGEPMALGKDIAGFNKIEAEASGQTQVLLFLV